MGRNPKEKKNYFCEKEESAIIEYINETDLNKKNALFNTILYPAFKKMIESLIRRYKLFIPDEDFDDNFNDTLSYLMTKIYNFKPEMYKYEEINCDCEKKDFTIVSKTDFKKIKRNATENDPDYIIVYTDNNDKKCCYKKIKRKYKAYSYCGTVCVNYLKYKCVQYFNEQNKNVSYENICDTINNDDKYTTSDDSFSKHAETLVSKIINEIKNEINESDTNGITSDEIKVGKSLIALLKNWESIFPENGSNKLQKSSILYYLREDTMMTTKELRDNIQRFKVIYYLLKDEEIK